MRKKIIKIASKGEIQENAIIGFCVINFFDKNAHSLNDIQKFAIAKNKTIEDTFNNGDILEVEVNDVEVTDKNKKKEISDKAFPIKLFNKKEAKRIIDFIEKNKDRDFIFQCDFGRSRSLTTAIFAHKFMLTNHKFSFPDYYIHNKSLFKILSNTYLFDNS